MMMNDWDYDVVPSLCRCYREKNETRKAVQQRDGWRCRIWIRRGLMRGEKGLICYGDEKEAVPGRLFGFFH